ncbi:hypothetical protein GDO81_012923 [Engystomops pustulosus]|uniref:Uncharacterized protein n=1 Tax=Engystomops pustulosus TaxID=76066 RepID=A0AAV7AVL8_ENGPU|nr:hypothetical protein GDO81_012923 [Engystomops pustulosus]
MQEASAPEFPSFSGGFMPKMGFAVVFPVFFKALFNKDTSIIFVNIASSYSVTLLNLCHYSPCCGVSTIFMTIQWCQVGEIW